MKERKINRGFADKSIIRSEINMKDSKIVAFFYSSKSLRTKRRVEGGRKKFEESKIDMFLLNRQIRKFP